VIGARPEMIRASPLSAALDGRMDELVVYAGQRYDAAMSRLQIADVRLPEPDFNLGVGSLPDTQQLALTEERVGQVIDAECPDAVLVRGDTNATLAAARAAAERRLPLFHVEAGLRSYRADMPEERNRVKTDRLADVLLAPTRSARDNLLAERIAGAVHVTGDVLADLLLATASWLPQDGESGDYVVATVHRNYNTDDPSRLAAVLECLGTAPCPVILPLHPRTRSKMDAAGLRAPANVELRDPVTYSEMLVLERDAAAIATDSGGVQREAYVWGVPCVTLREETEWVETVELGWNTLVGVDPQRFRAALNREPPRGRPPVFGNGHAAERIAQLLVSHMQGSEASVAC
jgi:UDP-N-acetylglucosamine 2-epimerase